MTAWRWIEATARRTIVWIGGEPLRVSPGGASLQACALVLIFAACVESQRPTCHACGLWHDDATPCEVHAPGIGELLERATAMGDMTEPKYITAAGLRVRVDDATEPLTLDRLDELAALGAELRMKRLREWTALRPWIRDGEG